MNDLIVQEKMSSIEDKIEQNLFGDDARNLITTEQLSAMSLEDRVKLYVGIEAQSFYLRGKILQSIKEDKCYKEAGYKTFEKAVKDILDISRGFAYKIMDATNTYEILSSIEDKNLPTAEAQLRPLICLPMETRTEIWQEVAKDRVPTAKEVQEAVNRRLGKVSGTKKSNKNSTIIDTTKYITIEEHNEKMLKLEKRVEQLQKTIEDMLPIVDKAMQFELKETIIDSAPEESTLLPREIVFNFIKQKGNSIQCHALKSDDLTNEKLYSIFVKVREDYKASTPPPAWDMRIINATGIL